MSHQLVFVHEGFPSHRGAYLVEKGELRLISRGIYAPINATDEDLAGDALRVLAYRYDGVRLMGESARRVMEDGLSPVLPRGQVFAASGSAVARRERDLLPLQEATLPVVLRPEWKGSLAGGSLAGGSLAGGSPFLSLSKRMVSDLGHGGMASWSAPCDAQILWDAAFAPECAPPPEVCMRLLQSIPEAHLDRLLSFEEMQKSVLLWEVAATNRLQEIRMPAQQRVSVFLQDLPVGLLAHDGVSWRMDWTMGHGAPISDAQWGATIESLMPEGWQEEMETAESMRDPSHFLRQPRRLMNWTFVNNHNGTIAPFNRIPLGAEMESHSVNGVFNGTMDMPWSNMDAMKTIFSVSDVPRISGFQPKVAGFLNSGGHLAVSDASSPFTILMKMDPVEFGLKKLEGIPVLEWACQNAGRHAGLSTANSALAVKPDGSSAILLSERFDVPRYGDYDRYDVSLDGAAAMGLHTSQKYNVSTAKLWKAFQENGLPSLEAGLHPARAFFDRFVAAWVMADGDLHIKNVSMIYSARNDGQGRIGPWTASMAPAYDMVCTRAFDFLKNDRMASVIEGKQDNLRMKDWISFGKRIGLREEDVVHRVQRTAAGIAEGLDAISRHPVFASMSPDYEKTCQRLVRRAAEMAYGRALDMGVDAQRIGRLDATEVIRCAANLPVQGDVKSTAGKRLDAAAPA